MGVLNRAETKVDGINENLNTAEHHIRTIKSWWGGFTNKFRKQPPNSNDANGQQQPQSSTSGHENREAEAAQAVANDVHQRQQIPRSTPKGMQSSTGQMHQYDLYENQIDSNLDQMSSGLNRLKNMGLGLNDELVKQDKQLNRLNTKMSRVDERTGKVNNVLRG